MGNKLEQLYYLSTAAVKKLSIQKKNWDRPYALPLEIVEISLNGCTFEWESRREFNIGEELNFSLDLPDGPCSKKLAIVSCEEYRLFDDNYEQKTYFVYRARFDGELENNLFKTLITAPRKCKSSR